MKSAIFLAEGFETCEALMVVDMLHRANLSIDMISIGEERIVKSGQQVSVNTDLLLKDCDFDSYDCMILPGGKLGTQNLEANQIIRSAIHKHANQGKLTCAICAAPSILGNLGLLRNKRYTCYPGFEQDFFGGQYEPVHAIQDANIITGQAMGASIEFARLIIRELAGEHVLETVESGMRYIRQK